MLTKIGIILLFAYSVLGLGSYIGDSKRAEIFELTDNDVAKFRVTLPEEEFTTLKEEGGKGSTFDFGSDFNFTSPDFNNIEGSSFDPFSQDSFKTKNATMTVEINGKIKSYKKVTFGLGGNSSRSFAKQGYNVKIRGNKDLYGRSQFKLRPDSREATYLRSKLVCDMHNRLGLPSISANYATLYINDEYIGFYILMDSIKLRWIEDVYDDPDSTSLYNCKYINNQLTVTTSSEGCVNVNDEVTDNTEWIEFLTILDNTKSPEDIEDIFDIDLFLTEIAFEFLSGSWDHYLNFGHNFNLYKPKNDKWKILYNDFDSELGQDNSVNTGFGPNIKKNTDVPSYSFEEFAVKKTHLLDILIFQNTTRFDNILKNFVTNAFNPTILFPHIDELKEFIRPYVELDKTPNENAGYYSFAEWEANCEFTTVDSFQYYYGYGLKYWILQKYRYICKTYNMDCDPVYMDENYQYTIDKSVEYKSPETQQSPEQPEPTTTVDVVLPQPTETIITPEVPQYNCWAELIGYPCCPSHNKIVFSHDGNGDWGYDFKTNQWCGITPFVAPAEECWSEIYGYSCCKGCTIYESDVDGNWGYEDGKWCGIPSYYNIYCSINSKPTSPGTSMLINTVDQPSSTNADPITDVTDPSGIR
ncbi:hypothetical protein BCR32DRAFT_281234 [Anaeromyces robustus]|uniref:CBM10 domain-containing protein n=1 Tax=Anaeromyces robustus TaxID=1754192 RepID=A0A1Y1X2J7_9FUNG|nr:hypothetical protein BCR32DRAFT_281234 [Anaeromyces robustus]|eukprot:ORX79626.1 hypothetical protein BCR32DRAFT_281234 [Anaeromyces robustus]